MLITQPFFLLLCKLYRDSGHTIKWIIVEEVAQGVDGWMDAVAVVVVVEQKGEKKKKKGVLSLMSVAINI